MLSAVLPLGAITLSAVMSRGKARVFAEDVLLLAQAMTVSGIMNQVARHAFARPRPYMYTAEFAEHSMDSPEDHKSFYSGHTAGVFAAATATSSIYAYRYRPGSARYWVWGSFLVTASAMPVLRVAAGHHFWTDVVTGACVGYAAGMLIPYIHRRQRRARSPRLLAGPRYLGVEAAF